MRLSFHRQAIGPVLGSFLIALTACGPADAPDPGPLVSASPTLEGTKQPLLLELGQRIRDVREGPDGLLYVLTAENRGALLRIEPRP